MVNNNFKINQQRRVPITRNSLFYDTEQLTFDLELGREYVETDMGQRIVLYRVDYAKTNKDQLYGEADKDEIIYLPPVEVPCVFEIKPAELRAYEKQKNLGVYQKAGNLEFGVYQYTLDEIGVDINIGDYVGVQATENRMVYYCVENDGRNNYDNGKTMFGTVPIYRTITCRPADEFNG